jgi:hypothetical protein
MSLVRRMMSEAVRASGPTITCFRKYLIKQDFSGTIPVFEFEFGVMDKGAFALPAMSALSFEQLPPMFTDILRHKLTDLVFGELYHRPKRVVAVDVTESTKIFWQRVIAEASTVGPEPMILVPFESIGEEISTALYLSGGQTPLRTERHAGGLDPDWRRHELLGDGSESSVNVVLFKIAVCVEVIDCFDHGCLRCFARKEGHRAGKKAHLVDRAKNTP